MTLGARLRRRTAPGRGSWRSSRAAVSASARLERRLALLLCAPAVLVILMVTGYPISYAIYLSVERYDLRFPAEHSFVGLANYLAVLSSHYWWEAFTATVVIAVVSVALELVIGMALALAMHRTIIGRGLVRTVVLIPYSIVTVVASYSWQFAWTPHTGYLARLLPEGTAPLADQVMAMGVIVVAEVWKTTPFMALLLLAGLALVPQDLLNAAAMDGAGPWQRLTKVILPIMKPAILVALLFRSLDALRIFDCIYVLTRGANGTAPLSMLGYDNLFVGFNVGIGSAISVLIFIVVAMVAFVFIRLFGVAAPGAAGEKGRH